MTASTLTQLPLMAGTALLSSATRAGQWAFARYMRAPLASTGLLAMVTLSALAGSNALYFQTTDHPAPFFAPARGEVASLPTPADVRPPAESVASVPQTMPTALPPVGAPAAAPVAETTGSVGAPPAIPDGPVGNVEVFAVQKRLAELNFFSGTVDGYYGPKTAQAIRAFEQHNNMPLKGALDPAVVQAILGSDTAGRATAAPVAQPAPQALAPAPVAAPQTVASVTTAPAPVAPAPQQDTLVAVLPQLSPAEQAFDQVAVSAANTLDSIIAAVDSSRTPPEQMANPPIPTASLPAAQPMPAPVQASPQPVIQAAAQAPVAAPPQPVAVASAVVVPPANDAELVMQIQRGLASLGFFRAPVDGKPGPETARAIREFENFHSYQMTGQVKPDLVELLVRAGAVI